MRKVLYVLGFLSDEDLDWMMRVGRVVHAEAPEVVIEQGRAARDLFLVLEGECAVTIDGIGQVAVLGSGELIGEMSFVDSQPPSATVTARPGTKLLAIDRADMTDRLESDGGFAGRLYKALAVFLSDRLRAATQARAGGGGRAMDDDELDPGLMDQVALAGLRFEHMLSRLLGKVA